MSIGISWIYKCIIISEIFAAGIVRWIDVDNVNLASMGLFQQSEAMKVIAFKKKIESVDYYGEKDDMAVSKLYRSDDSKI